MSLLLLLPSYASNRGCRHAIRNLLYSMGIGAHVLVHIVIHAIVKVNKKLESS